MMEVCVFDHVLVDAERIPLVGLQENSHAVRYRLCLVVAVNA